MATSRARVAMVGAQGFGTWHLENLRRLDARAELVAVADPTPPPAETVPDGCLVFPSLDALLTEVHDLDIVIVATPIHTHEALAIAAMRAGADVHVEKPTAASMAQFEQLLEVERATGRVVSVGFQSLGSHALPALLDGSLGIGSVESVTATGLWMRDAAYWNRSTWAGRRTLGGAEVIDGVTTNPLAHAVATALQLAGAREADEVASVDVDLYRANPIEADDTSVIRARTTAGITVTAGLTLCAPEQESAYVTVHGSAGDASLDYYNDVVRLSDGTEHRFERTELVENLLDHRESGAKLRSPLSGTGAFMRIVEAVRLSPPTPIDASHLEWMGDGDHAHPVVRDIGHWIGRATAQHATFRELGAPWAAEHRPA